MLREGAEAKVGDASESSADTSGFSSHFQIHASGSRISLSPPCSPSPCFFSLHILLFLNAD